MWLRHDRELCVSDETIRMRNTIFLLVAPPKIVNQTTNNKEINRRVNDVSSEDVGRRIFMGCSVYKTATNDSFNTTDFRIGRNSHFTPIVSAAGEGESPEKKKKQTLKIFEAAHNSRS